METEYEIAERKNKKYSSLRDDVMSKLMKVENKLNILRIQLKFEKYHARKK